MASDSLPRNTVLLRGLRLLQAAAARPEGSTALDLARAAGVPRATGGRLVSTLADEGFLERDSRGGWCLGSEFQRLARLASPHVALVRASHPVAARLAEASGESITVSVPHSVQAIEVVVQVDAPFLLSTTNWIGRLFALHASSAGKLVLADLTAAELEARYRGVPLVRSAARTITELEPLRAELERVRRQGFAESLDELEDGLVTMAAPVRGPHGELLAMLGLAGPSQRLGATRRDELVPALLEDARRLAALVAGSTA